EYTSAPGQLRVGVTYGYQLSYTTIYGETICVGPVFYTPSAIPNTFLSNFTQLEYGGLTGNADYTYAVSLVPAYCETFPPATYVLHTASGAGTGTPAFTGFVDLNGRIAPGSYAWASSFYSDQYGESDLGGQILNNPQGTPPPGAGFRIGIAVPGLPARADGI